MPKVSIIVPVYNTQKYLSKCLDSLINQTLRDIEIIIVNDGSTDNSEETINQYIKKDARIKAFNKKNGGQGSARNLGISQAKASFIGFVDSDDWVKADMFELLYTTAIKGNFDIVVCDFILTDNNKEYPGTSLLNKATDKIKNYIISIPSPCNKIYQKSLWQNTSFPEDIIYEDLATLPALALNCQKIAFIDEQLYYYLKRPNSTMNKTIYSTKLEDIFKAFDYLDDSFQKDNNHAKFIQEREFIYIHHLLKSASIRFLPFRESRVSLNKINNIIKIKYPQWRQNQYYQQQTIKYRFLCNLFYLKQYWLAKLLIKIKGGFS